MTACCLGANPIVSLLEEQNKVTNKQVKPRNTTNNMTYIIMAIGKTNNPAITRKHSPGKVETVAL
jgi:hypothetical protein